MSAIELLQLLTLLQVPAALAYIIRLEGRIARLEATLEAIGASLSGHMAREEKLLEAIVNMKKVEQ